MSSAALSCGAVALEVACMKFACLRADVLLERRVFETLAEVVLLILLFDD